MKWVVAFLNRLQEMGDETVDALRGDATRKKGRRFHPIDWKLPNVPLRRCDLDWLPSDYRDNEADYPLLQFQVSKARGRVHGFFDENEVFNIVLVDPLHNLQPSKIHNYRVDPCGPLVGEYEDLLADIEVAQRAPCEAASCAANQAFRSLPGVEHRHPIAMLRVGEDVVESVQTLQAAGRITGWEDVLVVGVLAIQEQGQKNTDTPRMSAGGEA